MCVESSFGEKLTVSQLIPILMSMFIAIYSSVPKYEPMIALPEIKTQMPERSAMQRQVFIGLVTAGKYSKMNNFTYPHYYIPLLQSGLVDKVIYFPGERPTEPGITFPYSYEPTDLADNSLHHLVGKFLSAVRYFLYETDDDWLFRMTEDVVINQRTFYSLLEEVFASGNPRTDLICKAMCISFCAISYPQGGSGFVISRRVAETFIQNITILREIQKKHDLDDQVFGLFLQAIGIAPYNFSSRWFLGHPFTPYTNATFFYNNIRNLPKCPPTFRMISKCRPFFQRLKDVAVWHEIGGNQYFVYAAEEIREKMPSNVFFYNPDCFQTACIGDASMQSHYIE